MERGRPLIESKEKTAIRVLLPRTDYEALQKIARAERTDIGSLVRRAIVYQFFGPDGDPVAKRPKRWPNLFAFGSGHGGGRES